MALLQVPGVFVFYETNVLRGTIGATELDGRVIPVAFSQARQDGATAKDRLQSLLERLAKFAVKISVNNGI